MHHSHLYLLALPIVRQLLSLPGPSHLYTEEAEHREEDRDQGRMDECGEHLTSGPDVEESAYRLQANQSESPPGPENKIMALPVRTKHNDQQAKHQQPYESGGVTMEHLDTG